MKIDENVSLEEILLASELEINGVVYSLLPLPRDLL